MTGSDLEDRLARLADGEVSAPTPRPDDLWKRGRRWQRRRRVFAAVTGAAVVVLASGLVTSVLPFMDTGAPDAGPAANEVAPRIPDRLFEPSPWLGTLPDEPVVAVMDALRGSWRGTDLGLVGISALTGEYGFLDLPDRAGDAVALSPDGERLAYWLAGEPAGEPQVDFGQTRPTVGVVVRDLRTGEEHRHHVETEHGLRGWSLFWMDEDTLVFDYGQFTVGASAPEEDQGGSVSEGALWWRPGESAPVKWPWRRQVPSVEFWSARDGDLLGTDGEAGLIMLDAGQGKRTPVQGDAGAEVSSSQVSTVALGPDMQVALIGSKRSQQTPNRVWVSRLTPQGEGLALADRTAIPGVRKAYGLLGWRDGDLLAMMTVAGEGTAPDRTGVVAVDPATGDRHPVVTESGETGLSSWQLARGLLETAEVVEGRQPPDPLDPRLAVALWAGGLVVVVLGAFLVWRRRGRP